MSVAGLKASPAQALAERRRAASDQPRRGSRFDGCVDEYVVGTTHELPTDRIRLDENTRRGEPDPSWIAELRADMEDQGQLQNAGVWVDDDGTVRLLFGFCRYHAAAGSDKLGRRLRVIVRPRPSRGRESTLATQISENERRKDLSLADRAGAYDDLVTLVASRWASDPEASRREALETYGASALTPDAEVAARLRMSAPVLSRYRTIASCEFAPVKRLAEHPECRDPTSVADLVTLSRTVPEAVERLADEWIGSREPVVSADGAPSDPPRTPLGLRAATRRLLSDSRRAANKDKTAGKPADASPARSPRSVRPRETAGLAAAETDDGHVLLTLTLAGDETVQYRIEASLFDEFVHRAVVMQSRSAGGLDGPSRPTSPPA